MADQFNLQRMQIWEQGWGGKLTCCNGTIWTGKTGPGLLCWLSGEGSAYQRRRHGFNPWSGMIPRVTDQRSPCTTTTEPVIKSLGPPTTEPTCHSY